VIQIHSENQNGLRIKSIKRIQEYLGIISRILTFLDSLADYYYKFKIFKEYYHKMTRLNFGSMSENGTQREILLT
jgi:hypothetical protein